MSRLYVEPFGGLAGDMFLAALLDLGDPRWTLADLEALAQALLPGTVQFRLEKVWRQNLSGAHLEVRTPESNSQPHRGYRDLERIIAAAGLPLGVQQRALAVLWAIAQAEGRVHGCAPEEVHFHEIGAIDTLIDVCGVALALERLCVREVLCAPPLVGSGTVRCAHGEMPVPAPAVAELLRGRAMRLGGEGERLTPTAAALLVVLCERFEAPRALCAARIGYGAGTRDPLVGPPNLCRVQLESESENMPARTELFEGALQLDDMRGEELAPALEAIRAAGALDAWWTAVGMKKNRPGVLFSFLAREEARAGIEAAVLRHTSSLGLRWWRVERVECARESVVMRVDGCEIRIKLRRRTDLAPGEELSEFDISPEYEDLAAACLRGERGECEKRSLREWERLAIEAYRAHCPQT
jgi:uncharacterized protein (TIGR00299 family) protein